MKQTPPSSVGYTVPAPATPAKTRYTVVTDPDVILAIQRGGLTDPIGHQFGGQWFAEAQSLAQYREALPAVGGQP